MSDLTFPPEMQPPEWLKFAIKQSLPHVGGREKVNVSLEIPLDADDLRLAAYWLSAIAFKLELRDVEAERERIEQEEEEVAMKAIRQVSNPKRRKKVVTAAAAELPPDEITDL